MKRKPVWKPSLNFCCQAAHLLLGLSAVFGPMALWGKTYAQLGTVLLVVYGGIKEPFVDPWLEGDPFWWDGFEDMSFLYGGAIAAWVLYALVR